MKNNKFYTQNSTIATFDNTELLKAIVERLAGKHLEYGYQQTAVPAGWRSIDTSTVEAYVSGKATTSGPGASATQSFESCFLFTCIRASKSEYNLTWAYSLS